MSFVHEPMEPAALNGLGILNLAHVGDGVYELLVRDHLARGGAMKLAEQHRRTIAFVSAPAQAAALERLMPLLGEEERKICRRGRNARVHGVPSGCTIAEYHAATALETLFGWLWLAGRPARIAELFESILEGADDAT